MIPTMLAREVRRGVEDYIRTTFPVTSPYFGGMLDRFLRRENGLFRGPFVFLGLPFSPGRGRGEFFPEVPLGYPPYLHQEKAFARMAFPRGKSTVIATGTGSGKTECFLWPVLDYCLKRRDTRGIKALFIYPMNALASDQAQRTARAIWDNPGLKGRVTAGLYVGHDPEDALDQPVKAMERDKVISCRYTLRENPPDILLTNYKMLDFLLLRPADRDLWRYNTPDTLKYLVVDELHTFDGAQGTDLSCLLRRLKSRLDIPSGHLCCVGTSATLGEKDNAPDVLGYAASVFGEPFDADALITEERLSAGEFLENDMAVRFDLPDPGDTNDLDPESFDSSLEYLGRQAFLWFGDEGPRKDGESDDEWRVRLGTLLRGHVFFQNFLKVLGGRPMEYSDLLGRLVKVAPRLGEREDSYGSLVLDSLVSLVSHARKREGERLRPLVTVQVQGWLREMRRMVASVPLRESRPELFFSDDLKADRLSRTLPVIHCRDCGAMGWTSSEDQDDGSVEIRDLKSFYSGFFNKSRKIRYLFPGEAGGEHRGLAGKTRKLCPSCMTLSDVRDDGPCPVCGEAGLVPVFVPDSQYQKTLKDGTVKVLSTNDCPFCGSSRGLSIFGARSTTLSSVMISQTMTSRGNDDKKMLAFSDSVQDAAHHAGFFGARTYRFTLRTAMAKYIADGGEGKTLSEFAAGLPRYWSSKLDGGEYVSTFIAPDQAWRREFARLKETGTLPGGVFLENLSKRLGWEAFTEFGLNSHIGRTLEKSGVAVASPDPAFFAHSAALVLEALRNELPGMAPPEEREVSFFLSGLVQRMKTKGALYHPELEEYIRRGGEGYLISKERKPWMPSYGKRTRRPLFLSTSYEGDFDRLSFTAGRNWYCQWMTKCFGENNPLILTMAADFWRTVLGVLSSEPSGMLRKLTCGRRGNEDPVWALEPSSLRVTCSVAEFRCSRCGASFFADANGAEVWNGLPCPGDSCDGRLEQMPASRNYYGRLYRTGDLCRLFPAEHTGMLPKGERSLLEAAFKKRAGRKPWDPNLLSCTPTLEMGIDIGDLSTLMLCSVPPDTASFRQRVGRAGRRDGNSLSFTVANGRPHDLYFFGEPLEMIVGDVEPPGVFLGASAVLERQFAAFCLDCWVREGTTVKDLPEKTSTVLNQLDGKEKNGFPYSFLNFVDRERTALLDRFFALFGGEISDDVKEHIEHFASSSEEGIALRLLDGLRRMQKQRASLQHKAKALRKALGKLKEDPAAKKEEIEALSREKRALERLFRDIGELPLFNLLTDEGLIPNYAFPESGVVLRSVIYRKLDDGRVESDIFKYERAAGSALRELAPASSFYAGGRKVKIEQVDMSLSEVEEWRFCNVCSYMERVSPAEKAGKCPRCGSSGFGDLGQKRKLLRMKQVYAYGDDKSTLIADDSDDRETVFYVDQTLVNFDEKDVTKAWRSEDTGTPFGFEFISRAVFREVNFGMDDDYGERVSIDGKELPRKGFLICRHCGRLQPENGEQKHTSICPARNKESEANLADCVYLYRELQSEALRILLPISSTTAGEQDVRSFTAALQLGFKKYFRGGTDHLRCTLYQEPVSGSELRRTYLLVYDTVPGGTGYLKQLALDSGELMSVLQKALDVLISCSCAKDPERDGCYRCIYAYGASFYMKDVSRRRAVEMISSALEHRDSMLETDTVSHIEVNASFDSELEALFVEALRRAVRNVPDGEMFKQVINGKSGYFIRRGGSSWYLEPQVYLGKEDGVPVASKADFVFWPARSKENVKPVVVFTDGYAFHRSSLGQDIAKRTAILRSGRFQVWSITWKDVHGFPGNTSKPVKDPFYTVSSRASRMMMSNIEALDGHGPVFFAKAHEKDVLSLFLQSLFFPGEASLDKWRKYARYRAMMLLSPDSLAAQAGSAGHREALRSSFRSYLPEWAAEMLLEEGRVPSVADQGASRFCYSIDIPGMGKDRENSLRLALFLDDREEMEEPDWRAFLRAMNIFQFIEGVSFFTSSGVESDEYGMLKPVGETSTVPGRILAGDEEDDRLWKEALDLLLDPEGLESVFAQLQEKKWPAPVVGYDFPGDGGTVLAQAEVAWPMKKIALLSKYGMEDASAFDSAGWRVLPLDDIRNGKASALFSTESQEKEAEQL